MYFELFHPCYGCNRYGFFKPLCLDCSQALKPNAKRFKIENYEDVLTIFDYAYTYRKMHNMYKFRLNQAIGDYLSLRLLESFPQVNYDYIDLCIPIAQTSTNILRRGFNTNKQLYKQLMHIKKIPYADVLECSKIETSHFLLNKQERFTAVKNKFRIKQPINADLVGKTVLVVDDIFTTGATLTEVGKLLKQNGVKKIYGLCLAKTPLK